MACLKITRQGITVDPERVDGLMRMSQPTNLGDVWQFNSAVGWMDSREHCTLFGVSSKLTRLRTKAMKKVKGKDIVAARRITLEQTGWTADHQRAWDTIHESLVTATHDMYFVRSVIGACRRVYSRTHPPKGGLTRSHNAQ